MQEVGGDAARGAIEQGGELQERNRFTRKLPGGTATLNYLFYGVRGKRSIREAMEDRSAFLSVQAREG